MRQGKKKSMYPLNVSRDLILTFGDTRMVFVGAIALRDNCELEKLPEASVDASNASDDGNSS